MTIYVPVGEKKPNALDFDTTQFSISGTTISVGTAGAKTVSGPATNTANYIPQWNGADSALLKDGVECSTDGTMGGNSDSAVPTEKAVKTYAAPVTTTTVILDASVQAVTVGNTTNETTLYTFSTANTLGTANALKLTLINTYLHNASGTLAIKLKYGSTTVATIAALSSNNSATTTGLKIEAFLVAQGATNSQFGLIMGLAGIQAYSESNPYSAQGTAAEDSTGALNLVITAQWSSANASLTLTTKYAILEKIIAV